MHHIFVDENFIDAGSGKIIINKNSDTGNFNHLVKVLRVKIGELVLCSPVPFSFTFDYSGKVCDITNDEVVIDIKEKVSANELFIKINLYQGLPKSDKLEFIIEKAVELGVYSITPVENEFSVTKMDGKKIVSKIERYNKISKSAAEQSRRNIIPVVKEPIDFEKLIKELKVKNQNTYNILFYENAKGLNNTREYVNNIRSAIIKLQNENSNNTKTSDNIVINVIIGPEGGFSDKEIDMANDAGIEILSLGDRILRTETAAVTALSILAYSLQF